MLFDLCGIDSCLTKRDRLEATHCSVLTPFIADELGCGSLTAGAWASWERFALASDSLLREAGVVNAQHSLFLANETHLHNAELKVKRGTDHLLVNLSRSGELPPRRRVSLSVLVSVSSGLVLHLTQSDTQAWKMLSPVPLQAVREVNEHISMLRLRTFCS